MLRLIEMVNLKNICKMNKPKKIYFIRAKLTDKGIKFFEKETFNFFVEKNKYILYNSNKNIEHILCNKRDMKLWSRPMEFTVNGWCLPKDLKEFKNKCLIQFRKDLKINMEQTEKQVERLRSNINNFERQVNKYCK